MLVFFCVPFLIVGYYITIGRFNSAKKIKKHTYYAITNKRVIIQKDKMINVKSYEIHKLDNMNLELYSDGNGNIKFDSDNNYRMYGYGQRRNFPDSKILYGNNFINIKDAKKVYDMIKEN